MEEKKKTCPYCGRDLLFEDDVCPYCGKTVKKRKHRGLWFWLILLVLVAVPLVGILELGNPLDIISQDGEPLIRDWGNPIDSILSIGEPEYIREIREDYPELTHRQAEAMYELKWYLENEGGSPYMARAYLENYGFRNNDCWITLDALEAQEGVDWTHQAVLRAQTRLSEEPYSRTLLLDELEYDDGFTRQEAEDAVESLDVDWMEMAAAMAQNYAEFGTPSYAGLENYMHDMDFSEDQIQYAMEHVVADWKENALSMAEDYVYFSGWEKDDLYHTLVEDDLFTEEQARYAVDHVEFD